MFRADACVTCLAHPLSTLLFFFLLNIFSISVYVCGPLHHVGARAYGRPETDIGFLKTGQLCTV